MGKGIALAGRVPESLTMRLGLVRVGVHRHGRSAEQGACRVQDSRYQVCALTARSIRHVACPPLPLIIEMAGCGQPSTSSRTDKGVSRGERGGELASVAEIPAFRTGSKSSVRCASRRRRCRRSCSSACGSGDC